ncbi:MAG TPA: SIMPL domain-containing protein [Longimicrobium sp.]|nr:SIMPL domain-containing protein [Longimicrobium sp.]
MRRNTTWGATSALALALLAGAASAANAQPGMPMPETPPSTIRVSATGDARATPDRAWVDFGVETVATTAREAAEANAARMERVIAALVRAGVTRENIQTRDYNIYPDYQPDPRGTGEPRIRGYRATNTVSAQTDDVRRVGALIDAALGAEANRVNGVRFGLRDPARGRAQALQDAIRQGRAEAEAIAQGLGVRLGRVLDASTAYGGRPPVMPMYDRAMAVETAAAATPVEPGQQTVTATVTLVFAIEP